MPDDGSSATPNFIADYMSYHEGTEVPEMFALWCGLFAMSAAVGRRVWVDVGRLQLFPNLFVVLVASSGRHRKSTAINTAGDLLRNIQPPPNFISQSITKEALVDALRVKEIKDGKKILADSGEGVALVSELGTFLNKFSYESGMGTYLIDLYDCLDPFTYETKSGGKQGIARTCLGLLGASTVFNLSAAIPEAAVGDGLTSRIVFVYVQDPTRPVPFPAANPELRRQLISHLEKIASYRGPFTITPEAANLYVEKYKEWFGDPDTGKEPSPFFEEKSLSGYASRRFDHTFKIAMLLSIAERSDLVLTESHIAGAMELLATTEAAMPMALRLITSTAHGNLMEDIFVMISRSQGLRWNDILLRVANRIPSKDLDSYLDTLCLTGRVEMTVQNGTRWYFRKRAKKE